MFTGIVEELGTVKTITKGANSALLKISASAVLEDASKGDSICVNGVCLTAVEFTSSGFTADVMAETLWRTNLGELKPGDRVNLERALRPSDRMGGHMVSGHIDAVGTIRRVQKEDIASVFTVEASDAVIRYVIEKGSIAIDGISLTVVDVDKASFRVSIIPHTMANTTLGFKREGAKVNLEADMIAKYVERLLPGGGKSGLSKGFLAEHGFM